LDNKATGADPYRFPPLYRNHSDFSERVRYPGKETLGSYNPKYFPGEDNLDPS